MKSEGPVILAAFANDHSDQARFLRNLSTEAQRIQKVLEPAQDLCPLVLLPGAKLEDILDAFQKYRDRVVVFHYAGHANGFQLLLESASGGVHRIGAKGLASFLGQQQGLQLVFLNGCSTERQAEDLLAAGVGCVIATTQAIDDAVATDFSARFYKGIVTGAPLQAAYSEAVGAAQAFSGGSIDRLLVPLEGEEEVPHETGRWPWLLKLRPGAERVAQWSLPEAAGDPLFGLPPVKPRDLPESPYRHLYRFEDQHAEVFFGRGREIRELYQRVTAPDSPPVVLFYGPAGVGKSSLLDAGLIPRLEGKNEVRYERREPTLGLGNSLRLAFPMEFRKLSRRDAWIAAEKQLGRPLVIVLDQIEEAFTKPNPQQPNELEEFAQLLRRIFFSAENRPQGRLILGFRKEWFAEIDERLADAQVPRSRIFLERLCREGAIEAITGPVDDPRLASHYQLSVEAGLPEVIADDLLADPDTPVAPTLQILLTRMWSEACRRNREKPTFDTELYQSLHRDGILLDDFLKQQTEQIRSQLPQAVDSGFLLDLLEFHTTAIGTSAEHPVSKLEQTYSEQAKSGLLAKTLKLCEEAYLLTFSVRESDDGPVQRSSRLLHDTLAPLIRARHEESDLPGQRARRILDNRVVDWSEGKAGIPLDAKDLKEVESALEGTRSWSADEQRLVTASREQRSSNRRWKRILQGLGIAAVVMIAASGAFAYFKNLELNQKNLDLAEQTTKAKAATQKAGEAADEAKQQTIFAVSTSALSFSQIAETSRDFEKSPFRSAHNFAASRALSSEVSKLYGNSPTANERSVDVLSLNHVMGDVEIVDSLVTDNRPVHEVWRLKSTGEILVWSGDPTMTQFWIWDSEGLLKGLQLRGAAKQCVLLPDESHLAIQLNDEDFLLLDTRTWGKSLQTTFLREYWIDRQTSRPDFSTKLAEKGLSPLVSTVESLTGDKIWDVAFDTGGTKVLIWTAAWVHPPWGYTSVPNVPEGVAQVWDTQARIPLTPPLKIGSELRGAKFLSDEHIAIWGENGRVMIWDISGCRRISNVQITKDPPSGHPAPEGDQGKFWVPMNSKGYRVYWDGSGWGIEKQIPDSLDYEPVLGPVAYTNLRGMFQPKNGGIVGWGGNSGSGVGSGGFVAMLSTNGNLESPVKKMPFSVCNVSLNSRETLLLATTWNSTPGDIRPAFLHLWLTEAATQVMPPIPILNFNALESEINAEGTELTIRAATQLPGGDTEYVTFQWNITPDKTLDPVDPRLDVVRRTGTYLGRDGVLAYLSRPSLQELRANPKRWTYDEWFDQTIKGLPIDPATGQVFPGYDFQGNDTLESVRLEQQLTPRGQQ